MRWLFLSLLLVIGTLANLFLITRSFPSSLLGFAIVDLMLLGLGLIWYGAYFETTLLNPRSQRWGFALLCMSLGIWIASMGVEAAVSQSCEGLTSSRSRKLREQFFLAIQSWGYCRELGYFVGGLGVWVTWIGLKRVFRMALRRQR
ncbi:hypothetical protein [Polaromonas sp.]|uniref:hypothetical protein n=1 Tax=Polaromonas sp. TaxID=1869339 RepID=UPI003C8403DE